MGLKKDILAALEAGDHDTLKTLARTRLSKVLRVVSSRLFAAEEQAKWQAVEGLGALAADPEVLPGEAALETLRRFTWAMNDESGAVPYGIPEGMGAILKQRPEFHEGFLGILCSMVTHEDMIQTGPIERGVYWALGHVGAPVKAHSEQAVLGLHHAARNHEDPETRCVATEALIAMGESPNSGQGLIQL